MKLFFRAFIIALVTALTFAVVIHAESRGKALKRAEKELRAGNFEQAEAIYNDLLTKNQDDKEARMGLSFSLLKQNKLIPSFEAAAQIVATDSLNGRAFGLMGTALLRSGEFRTSLQSLLTALKLDNKDHLALAGLAELEYFEHRTRNAYDALQRAIQLEPREPDYYVSQARVCSRLELYSEAADAYQNFLSVAPKTDEERRARIRGLIDFYRYLGTTKLHRQSGPDVVTIPFELHGNRPFITVKINNKQTLRFVIDTGASLSVISDKAAEKLSIKPIARGGHARAVGGSGEFGIVYGLLDSVSFGEAKVDLVPAYIRTVHSPANAPDAERADGYIGLSVLSNFAVTIDYKEKKLILDRTPLKEEDVAATTTAPSTAAPVTPIVPPMLDDKINIPLRSTSGGLASAEGLLDGHEKPFNFIIDTGASTTVISKSAVKRFSLENMKLKNMIFQVVGAAGVENDVEALGLASLTVNNLRQRNARALILNLDPVNETSGFEQHGIIGGDFLRHFLVHLDLRQFKFHLTPQGGGIERIVSK
ncbi:MAG: aspartyl protease family protein [Acidobacteria bacterium]|nr:aspartyl protease family protein [Acidobacteriota bacterium]